MSCKFFLATRGQMTLFGKQEGIKISDLISVKFFLATRGQMPLFDKEVGIKNL